MSGLMTGPAVAEKYGISYRQLDYWLHRGYLKPAEVEGLAATGTGHHRIFTAVEAEVARWMGELVRQGIKPETAGPLAKQLAETGEARFGMFRLTTPVAGREDAASSAGGAGS